MRFVILLCVGKNKAKKFWIKFIIKTTKHFDKIFSSSFSTYKKPVNFNYLLFLQLLCVYININDF